MTIASPSAVFVSNLGAPGNPGTQAAPLSQISAGLALSLTLSPHPPVFVAAGVYSESPVFPDGVSVFGGYGPSTWLPQPGVFSLIFTGTTPAVIQGAGAATSYSGLDVQASNAVGPGGTSTAVRVLSSSCFVANCRFIAAAGTAGSAGATESGEPGAAWVEAGRQGRPAGQAA